VPRPRNLSHWWHRCYPDVAELPSCGMHRKKGLNLGLRTRRKRAPKVRQFASKPCTTAGATEIAAVPAPKHRHRCHAWSSSNALREELKFTKAMPWFS